MRNYNRPRSRNRWSSNNRSYNKPRRFGGSRRVKRLNPDLFVKKATTDTSKPMQTNALFSDFALSDNIQQILQTRGFTKPTPIQEASIPTILEGRDVIGIASTGTGKTLSFLLPIIHKASMNSSERAIILAPTRELALQIHTEFKLLTKNMRLYSALCIGGAYMRDQVYALSRNPHCVIATPGRFNDLLKRNLVHMADYSTCVLDEADRMLDMGFRKDIQLIISKLPQKRQTLLFSATFPSSIKQLAHTLLSNPEYISVQTQKTSQNVDQDIVKVAGRNKVDVLHDLLIQKDLKKVLVFGRTKFGVEKLKVKLVQRGLRVDAIHGNKKQNQRQQILQKFKRDSFNILLATDVASRGLDIDNITHVINFDAPETYDDYVHRIGRTGRAHNKGIALTFVD